MGKVVFLYRSLAYRNAAADMLRKARKLPRGAERSAARRYATALRDLAQTEAWLEGRVADERRRPREALEEDAAEGVNVRGGPDGSGVLDLLRRYVGECFHALAGPREVRAI